MGIRQNFVLAPAHAQLNWSAACCCSCLACFTGSFRRLNDHAGRKGASWLIMIGAICFPAGVAVVLLKGPSFEAAPIGGSLIVIAAMALFVVIGSAPRGLKGGEPPLCQPSLFKLIRGIVRGPIRCAEAARKT